MSFKKPTLLVGARRSSLLIINFQLLAKLLPWLLRQSFRTHFHGRLTRPWIGLELISSCVIMSSRDLTCGFTSNAFDVACICINDYATRFICMLLTATKRNSKIASQLASSTRIHHSKVNIIKSNSETAVSSLYTFLKQISEISERKFQWQVRAVSKCQILQTRNTIS